MPPSNYYTHHVHVYGLIWKLPFIGLSLDVGSSKTHNVCCSLPTPFPTHVGIVKLPQALYRCDIQLSKQDKIGNNAEKHLAMIKTPIYN